MTNQNEDSNHNEKHGSPREYVTQIEHRFSEWPPELRKAAAMLLAPEAFTPADRSVVAGMLVSFAGEISK